MSQFRSGSSLARRGALGSGLAGLVVVASLGLPQGQAAAATPSSVMGVTATVEAQCLVTATAVRAGATANQSAGAAVKVGPSILVTCNTLIPYTLKIVSVSAQAADTDRDLPAAAVTQSSNGAAELPIGYLNFPVDAKSPRRFGAELLIADVIY
jgi:spore coat protein U-like protein